MPSLQDEILESALLLLDDISDLARFATVSRYWHERIHSESFWKSKTACRPIPCYLNESSEICMALPTADAQKTPWRKLRNLDFKINKHVWAQSQLASYSNGLLCWYKLKRNRVEHCREHEIYLFDPCKSSNPREVLHPPKGILRETDFVENLSFSMDERTGSYIIVLNVFYAYDLIIYRSRTRQWSYSKYEPPERHIRDSIKWTDPYHYTARARSSIQWEDSEDSEEFYWSRSDDFLPDYHFVRDGTYFRWMINEDYHYWGIYEELYPTRSGILAGECICYNIDADLWANRACYFEGPRGQLKGFFQSGGKLMLATYHGIKTSSDGTDATFIRNGCLRLSCAREENEAYTFVITHSFTFPFHRVSALNNSRFIFEHDALCVRDGLVGDGKLRIYHPATNTCYNTCKSRKEVICYLSGTRWILPDEVICYGCKSREEVIICYFLSEARWIFLRGQPPLKTIAPFA